MAPTISQMLVLEIDNEHELHVLPEGRCFKFVLKEKKSKAVQVRAEFKLGGRSSMKLSMFLAGIRDAMPRPDFEDEPTLEDSLKGKVKKD